MSDRPAGSVRLRAAACACAALLALGCRTGSFENENDDLRRRNMELAEQVAELQDRIELRENEIDALEQQLHDGTKPMEGVASPRLVAVRLGRYSGPLDTDGDGVDDQVRVYVQTLDQQSRFMPVAGRASLQIAHVQPEQEPKLIAERVYESADLDAAYRTGLTGTHYTLETPLPQPLPAGVGQITVTVFVTSADTGATLSDTQTFNMGTGAGEREQP